MATTNKSPKLSEKEALAIVEQQRQERIEGIKNFFTGMAKAVTTDLPGFLMDFADKLAGDTATFGEKDRSAQLFEAMTGIKTASGKGGVDELVGSMVNPVSGATGIAKAVILPAFAAGRTLGDLNKAQQLRNLGKSSEEIFSELGIYPDPMAPGLKTVVSDANSKLLTDQLNAQNVILTNRSTGDRKQVSSTFVTPGTKFSVTDILVHPELERLAPRTLRDLTVVSDPTGFGGGAFNPGTREITLQRQASKQDLQSVLLHEIQHAIQEDFSMPKGGNSEMFFRNFDVFDAAKSKVTQLLSDPDYIAGLSSNEIAELINSKRSFADLSVEAFNLYERLPGEAESRAVQSLFESGGALSSRAPTSYYDVPISELINPWEVGKLDERPEIKTLLEFIRRLPEPSK